nr:hypothetical transcript [Hymenolepis microstoma]
MSNLLTVYDVATMPSVSANDNEDVEAASCFTPQMLARIIRRIIALWRRLFAYVEIVNEAMELLNYLLERISRVS